MHIVLALIAPFVKSVNDTYPIHPMRLCGGCRLHTMEKNARTLNPKINKL